MMLALIGGGTGHHRVYSQDGEAHITYYLAERQLSFVWSGKPTRPIEVEHGGYAERLVAIALLGEDDLPETTPSTPQDWLLWFEDLCQKINQQLPEFP